MSLKKVIDDMATLQTHKQLGMPDWQVKLIAEQMVKNWDWLY